MRVLTHYRRSFEHFLNEHGGATIVLIAFFVIGVIFGSIAVYAISGREKVEYVNYLSPTIQGLLHPPANEGELLLKRAVLREAKSLGILWLLGISVVGIPVVLVFGLVRGYVSGFLVAYLTAQMGWKGLLLAAAGILPQMLIEVPALALGGAAAVRFSLQVIRSWRDGRRMPHFYRALGGFTGRLALLGLALLAAGLVEAYLTPGLVRLALAFVEG